MNGFGLIWKILLNTVLGYALYVWLLKKMTVVEFTFAGIANPVAGITAAFLLLNESYNSTQYLLMACMILASLMPQMIATSKRHRRSNINRATK